MEINREKLIDGLKGAQKFFRVALLSFDSAELMGATYANMGAMRDLHREAVESLNGLDELTDAELFQKYAELMSRTHQMEQLTQPSFAKGGVVQEVRGGEYIIPPKARTV